LIKLPTIQSVGAPLEEHADRVVAEMMRIMVQSRLGRDSLINAAINLPDGNPKAQAKLAKKLQDIGWPFIFDVNLFKSGKRGRYVLDFCSLNGWNPITKKLIFDAQSIPHNHGWPSPARASAARAITPTMKPHSAPCSSRTIHFLAWCSAVA
jgi:hypothetical protein